MTQLTFKQYNEALEIARAGGECPDFLQEGPIWDKIKAVAKGELQPHQVEKLHALSVKGDTEARATLDAYIRAKEKEGKLQGRLAAVSKAHQAHKEKLEKGFQSARAEVEADERGSSRAYDKETGSVNRKKNVRWDAKSGQWVTDWSHVGKRG